MRDLDLNPATSQASQRFIWDIVKISIGTDLYVKQTQKSSKELFQCLVGFSSLLRARAGGGLKPLLDPRDVAIVLTVARVATKVLSDRWVFP